MRGWNFGVAENGQIPRAESVVYDSEAGVIGTQWQTTPMNATVGSNDYYGHFDILVHKTQQEAEAARKSELEELNASVKEAPEGSAEWHRLKNKIASYSQPLRFVQLQPRLDTERSDPPHVDRRVPSGQLLDVRVGGDKDPNVETWDRFQPAIRAMQHAKLVPDGEWRPGTTWAEDQRLSASWADEEDEDEPAKGRQLDTPGW